MKDMKTYTIGEITRLGLLKNHKGEPYKHKATISRIISSLNLEKKKTPWGFGYQINQKTLDTLNKRFETCALK